MREELSRETRKLEVRLKGFLKKEEIFVKTLKKCLSKFGELYITLVTLKTNDDSKAIEELVKLRLEAITDLCEVLIKRSEVEHENSHLLESYGALILALEGAFKNFYP